MFKVIDFTDISDYIEINNTDAIDFVLLKIKIKMIIYFQEGIYYGASYKYSFK